MFALSILDIADKIYIIEYDSDWVEALEKTFEDYRDRVYIVRKMLSNIDNESECSLASFVKDNEKIDLVKLDIEGYEKIALSTVDELLIKHFDEFLVCVYHYQDEEKEIKDYFGEFKNTEIKTRSGFIYFLHDEKQKWPYLRRGVIRVKIN